MQKYGGTTVGPLKIPYISLCERYMAPFREKDLQIEIDPAHFEIPDENVKNYAKENQKTAEEKAKASGTVLFDGPMIRLTGYETDAKTKACKRAFDFLKSLAGYGSGVKAKLYVQPTSFFKHKFTNLSLDEGAVWRMVEERGADHGNLDDGLANAIGNEVVVVSKDGYTLIEERADTIAQYPGLYGIPSGFTDPDKDGYNPSKTAKRILKEQLNLEELESIELLGFGRAGDDRHMELQWLVRTNKNMDEILDAAPKPSKIKQRIAVKFKPENVAKYLSETVQDVPAGAVKRGNLWIPGESPKWVPAQAMAVIDALAKDFGYDRVERALVYDFNRL